uniref:Protein E7 n=1 Tax=Human papillomavirus TaxID=10566 RepID=A0A385PIV9_9PAPI|nr:MAG: E7 protein [Human papillomavirus]
MIGKEASLKDVELNLNELVLPENLLCDEESLSPDCEPEEEQAITTYKVDSNCYNCGIGVRICVAATTPAIRLLEELLLGGLTLLCPRCSRGNFHHGRSQ